MHLLRCLTTLCVATLLLAAVAALDQKKLDQMVWQYAEIEDRAGGTGSESSDSTLPTPPVAPRPPVPSTNTPPPTQGGDIVVSSNGEGNNIAIRNTNSIVLTPMPMGPAGYGQPQPGYVQPAPLPNNAPVNPNQQEKEYGDEQKIKADASAKAVEEKEKQTEVKLEPEWKNYLGDYEKASHVLFKNTICVVRGVVRGDQGLVGTLLESCRPSGRLVFTVMKTNAPARVDVLADGRIYYVAGGGGSNWISLSGITFTIDTHPGFNLVSWVNYGKEYRPSSLFKESGVCLLSGMIKDGPWKLFGNVDKDCWPDYRLIFSANNHENIARVDVLSNGQVQFLGGSSNHGWLSFDPAIWTTTGGMPLTLIGDWTNFGYYRDAKYERVGNLCIISGLIKNTNGWSGLITKLPTECRPRRRLIFGANVHTSSARVDVLADGSVVYITGKKDWEWLSLSGIHFTVE